jgi:hypothetical protein
LDVKTNQHFLLFHEKQSLEDEKASDASKAPMVLQSSASIAANGSDLEFHDCGVAISTTIFIF